MFGDGLQLRDFNYVDDVVDALLAAARAPQADGEVFNLGGAEHINLRDLAELIIGLHKGGEFRMVPFPPDRKTIDIGNYYGDYSKIGSALGWEPRVPLRLGLERSLTYYARHHPHYW